jgi:hypothetical protein
MDLPGILTGERETSVAECSYFPCVDFLKQIISKA